MKTRLSKKAVEKKQGQRERVHNRYVQSLKLG